MPRHLNQERATTSDPINARHVANPREASPDESERDTWTSHGPMGPLECLNRLKNTCTPGTNLRARRTATQMIHTLSGAHRGSAHPTGRSNRPLALHSGASTWCLPIGPKGHSRGICLLLTLVLSQWIEGEGLILRQQISLLLSHFWFVKLRARLE
jgi:hypothetical protein